MPKIISKKSNVDLDYPVVRPSLDLDFTQEELDPRITFSRGSIGTRVNRNRLIETVAANQPRFDYDPVTGECKGLLIEESRQNLIINSEDFGNASWSKFTSSIQTDVVTAPDGTTNADKMVVTLAGTTGGYVIRQLSITSGTTYTASCFVKAAEFSTFTFVFQSNAFGSNLFARFNLSTGTLGTIDVGVTASIQAFPNGWYRCIATATATSTISSGVQFRCSVRGDGTSGIYIWGAQLETGAFPTSYIPTSGSTVTRNPELVDMTGTNFSSWYNQTEGTFVFDGTLPFITNDIVTTGTTARVPYGVSNGLNFSNSIYVSKGTTSLGLSFSVINNNVGQVQGNTAITTMTSSRFKIASSVANKSIYLSGYGGAINKSSRPSASIPTVNKLSLGKEPWNSGASNPMIGCIARFTYYPRALKPSQLQFLTQ